MEKIKLPAAVRYSDVARYGCSAGCTYFRETWGNEFRVTRAAVRRVAETKPAFLQWLITHASHVLGNLPNDALSAPVDAVFSLSYFVDGVAARIAATVRDFYSASGGDCGARADAAYNLAWYIHRDALLKIVDDHFDIPE